MHDSYVPIEKTRGAIREVAVNVGRRFVEVTLMSNESKHFREV